jgi:deferrochelatase/peroxidase EfeB
MSPFSRRAFLGGALAGTSSAVVAGIGSDAQTADASSPQPTKPVPFHGAHQAGVLEPESAAASFAAFDVMAETRQELTELLRTITDRARLLTAGGPPADLGPASPPDDNGILGPIIPAEQVAFTFGMGASLFDDRFGLSHQKPAHLTSMKTFPNDNLNPAETHGDVIIKFQAAQTDTVIHALRDVAKHTRGAMQPRWRIDGSHGPPRPSGTPRNYLGFKDGIAHPDVKAASIADSLIWVQRGAPEPAWTAGGTYQVTRIIRMLVEFWDRVSLDEQETMIGRRKASGAPLDGNSETDKPDYHADPSGSIIPLDAHIRLANPRTKASEPSQILRHGFNYDRGIDVNGNLDQGLIFTAFQQNIARQFETVQRRLIDEPLVDYISPVGGGYFFVPAGVRDRSDFFGRQLLA